MDEQQIYEALDPSWWLKSPSLWSTDFYSTVVVFNTPALSNCTYTSSAPSQTNGLNAGQSGISPSALVDSLRRMAARRLFDSQATAVVGHSNLVIPFNATA